MSKLPINSAKIKALNAEKVSVIEKLEENEFIAKSIDQSGESLALSIPEKFRNAQYFARGQLVLGRKITDSNAKGEIVKSISKLDMKSLHAASLWPSAFITDLPKISIDKEYFDIISSESDHSDENSDNE